MILIICEKQLDLTAFQLCGTTDQVDESLQIFFLIQILSEIKKDEKIHLFEYLVVIFNVLIHFIPIIYRDMRHLVL